MMKLKSAVFCWLLLLTASTCRAGLYPVMIGFDSITISPGFPWVSTIHGVRWGLREVGPDSEVPIIPPTRVGTVIRVSRDIGHIYNEPKTVVPFKTIIVGSPGGTIGDYAREVYEKGMLPSSYITYDNLNACIGVGAGQQLQAWASVQMPLSTCYELPPGEQWCDTDQSDLKIDFATLNMSSGLHQKSVAFHFRCSSAMKMRLEFIDDNIDLSNGMMSKMDVVESTDGWINSLGGDNLVHIRSTINTDMATKAGPFSGSTVMVIKYF
ncbi:hypothetical protein ABEH87_13165 [Erwinia sp. Eh17-17]|uniref:hypothetical protein n=1 Tax=Erwinia sp. Eh17-17 TaxID=3080330 RepID=UPI00320868A3